MYLLQVVVVDEIRSMLMNQSVERQSVAPTGGEVANVDVLVAGSFHLAP